MAKFTIEITDTDLQMGAYAIEAKLEDSTIDDGLATASAIVGHYLLELMATEDFRRAVWKHAEKMTTNDPTARFTNANDNPLKNCA